MRICGPGKITQTQSTYWEIELADGRRGQVNFLGTEESHACIGAFATLELMSSHALLQNHHEAWQHVFFSDEPANKPEIAEKLSTAIHEATQGFRTGQGYFDRGSSIEAMNYSGSHFCVAPASVASLATNVIEKLQLKCTVLPAEEYDYLRSPEQHLLIADRNYVIAPAFHLSESLQLPELITVAPSDIVLQIIERTAELTHQFGEFYDMCQALLIAHNPLDIGPREELIIEFAPIIRDVLTVVESYSRADQLVAFLEERVLHWCDNSVVTNEQCAQAANAIWHAWEMRNSS